MPSETEIREALQYPRFFAFDPINGSDDPRHVVTVQFANGVRPGDLPTATTFTDWRPLDADERDAIRAGLAHIETFLNVDFQEVTGRSDPDFNIGAAELGSLAGLGGNGQSWISGTTTFASIDSFVLYDEDRDMADPANAYVILHEIGHALGLKHPFEAPALSTQFDTTKWTLMSYTDNPDTAGTPSAMQVFDVLALQDIWGAANFNEGDDTYTRSRATTTDVVWDTGGVDTFDARDATAGVILDLAPGAYSRFGAFNDVATAFGVTIEVAKGSPFDDLVRGNDADNLLLGRRGDDDVRGSAGNDMMRGGSGADTLNGNKGDDFVRGNAGRDTVAGGQGDDKLKGGGAKDLFVFRDGWGTDRIVDFQDDRDEIDLTHFGFSTVDEALGFGNDRSSGAVFAFGDGDTLIVKNVAVADLADDILI